MTARSHHSHRQETALTITAEPPVRTPLRAAVAEHSPVADPDRWAGPNCHRCTTANERMPWPCGPLLDTADVTPIEGGWTIAGRPTSKEN